MIVGNKINGTQAECVHIPFSDTSLYKIPDNVNEEAIVMLNDKVDLHLEKLWSQNIAITTRLVDTVTTN